LDLAKNIAHALHADLQDFLFSYDGQIFNVSASIGVTVVTEHTATIESVLAAADSACYAAKTQGRNRYHVYDPANNEPDVSKERDGSVSDII
ncbi:MAG: diguanylate cyclase, partial [Gammaproteobacteria bacterium]|nr:diguanylate cyclase [Gammaproteobacteria bacterium]